MERKRAVNRSGMSIQNNKKKNETIPAVDESVTIFGRHDVICTCEGERERKRSHEHCEMRWGDAGIVSVNFQCGVAGGRST